MVKQSTTSTTLTIISELFRELQEHDIIYCHWKAHDSHMLASLSGDSDLDILFDSKQKSKLEFLLRELGFKRFDSVKQKQYKDIVDYLILDDDSGKLIHLHAHFKIRMGKLFLKEYNLNLEQRILHNRLFSVHSGTYCIHPTYQLVLLYLMESLKLRNRDRIRFLFNSKKKLSTKIESEYQWLKSKASLAEVRYVFHEILKHPAPVNNLIENELSLSLLFKLAHSFKHEFSGKKEYGFIQGLFTRWYREFILLSKEVLKRISTRIIPIKRINPRGGRVLVFYGKDKIIANSLDVIQNTYSKKLDTYRVTFDSGDYHKHSLSRRNRNKLNQIQNAWGKGMLVICDQFPVNPEESNDKRIQQYLPDILFKWLDDEDRASAIYEKTFDGSNDRILVVPIKRTMSFDKLCSLLKSETWKLL